MNAAGGTGRGARAAHPRRRLAVTAASTLLGSVLLGAAVVVVPSLTGVADQVNAVAAVTDDGLSPHDTGVTLLRPEEITTGRLHSDAPAVVSLTFDDGTQDQVIAANVLAERGLVATYFVTTGQTGAPGFLSRPELQGIDALGNEIGGHTVHHFNLPTLTGDEARRQICHDRQNLRDWGLPVQSFAYPYAAENDDVQSIVRECGYSSARGLGDAIGSGEALRQEGVTNTLGLPVVESLQPENPMLTKALKMYERDTGTDVYRHDIEAAIIEGVGWTQLTFHGICATGETECNDISISQDELERFADWLAARVASGQISVRTVGEVVGGDSERPVPDAVSTPVLADARLGGISGVWNAAGTSTASADFRELQQDGVPVCWSGHVYGDNTADFSVVRGPDGAGNALRTDLTSGGPGEAKWLPTLDMGECSLHAVGGESVDVTFTARGGGAQSQPVAYVRDAAGRWTYFSSGPFVHLENEWSEHTWKTPELPDGTTGLVVGLGIQRSGWNELEHIAVKAADE